MIDVSSPAFGWMDRYQVGIDQAVARLGRARLGRSLAVQRANKQAQKARAAVSDVEFLRADLEDRKEEIASLKAENARLRRMIGSHAPA